MRLHEEYIHRYALKIPVIQYDERSVVFLRSKSTPLTWRVLSIHWHPEESHPGYYEMSLRSPQHDGFTRNPFNQCMRNCVLYWDQYEKKVLSVAAELKREFIAVSKQEHYFTAWQFLLFIFDSALAHVMGRDFYIWVERCLSPGFSFADRTICLDNSIKAVKEFPDVYEFWRYEIAPLGGTHSQWLEDIING